MDTAATREIPLTHGKVAIVDAADYEMLAMHTWHAFNGKKDHNWYARSSIKIDGVRRCVQMHRVITGAATGVLVDHRDGDGLNNRRSNLRECDVFQSAHNRGVASNNKTGLKGVSVRRRGKRILWEAKIVVYGKYLYLGYFPTPHQASEAYQAAARRLCGEFARAEEFSRNAVFTNERQIAI